MHPAFAVRPYPGQLIGGAQHDGVPSLRLAPGLVALGVSGGQLRGGLGPDRSHRPVDPRGGELAVQRVGQRLHRLLQAVGQLKGLRHLAGQSGRVALAHPGVAGRPQAFVVVVAAVPEWPAGRGALRDRPSTVGTWPRLRVVGVELGHVVGLGVLQLDAVLVERRVQNHGRLAHRHRV
jgi:hypothetical protein